MTDQECRPALADLPDQKLWHAERGAALRGALSGSPRKPPLLATAASA